MKKLLKCEAFLLSVTYTANDEVTKDGDQIVKVECIRWKMMSIEFCGKRMPIWFNRKCYNTIVRSAMHYGALLGNYKRTYT